MGFEHINLMPVVYISGPYRASNRMLVARNIREAEEWGNTVAELGAFPFVPHANTAFLEGAFPDDFFLDGDLAVLFKADAALFIPRWEASSGARREREFAEHHGIPCFEAAKSLKENDRLFAWIDEFWGRAWGRSRRHRLPDEADG